MGLNKPVAVIISDVHYNLKNLELADNSMRQAISKANELSVNLIVAGDLHDTKANMRAECINAMIETFKLCDKKFHVMVGNHDRINEKSEAHSLNFLRGLSWSDGVHSEAVKMDTRELYMVPYYSNLDDLRAELKQIPRGSIVIMHQGIQGSDSGEYIQDKTAITKEDVAGLRVISGHYHKRQDIKLPDGGLWSYIGNPYTQNFAEANDPEKGFQILMDDGSLEFVPTNLRKHVLIENDISELIAIPYLHKSGDLVWFRLKGTKEECSKVTKQLVADNYGITDPFKLDLITIDTQYKHHKKQNLSQPELLDSIIDSLDTTDARKSVIKGIWKSWS